MYSTKRAPIIGLVVSLCAHLVCAVLLGRLAPDEGGEGGDGAILIDFDINEAPEAPAADMPVDDPSTPIEEREEVADETADDAEADTQPVEDDTVAIPPEPDPDAEEIATGPADAGVPDATTVAENQPRDAGPADAGVTAVATARADAGPASDAGLAGPAVASAMDTGPADAGPTAVASASTGAVGEADDQEEPIAKDNILPSMKTPDELATGILPTSGMLSPTGRPDERNTAVAAGSGDPGDPGSGGGPARTPSQANLLAYLPDGELVTVLIRFDRLHGTEWAEQTAAILAPMPDARALLGSRKVTISDLFRTLVVSSPSPRDVTATTVIGHSDMSAREIRAFLDHPEAPVTWTAARGGALGKRRRSRLIAPRDARLFLIPYPGWVVLTQKSNLGVLTSPASGDIDGRTAAPADLPPWLAALRDIERESGQDTGPAVIVTLARILPKRWQVPNMGVDIGEMSTPEQATLALEVTEKGFFVRGTLIFADPAAASDFVDKATRAQKDFVGTVIGRALLAQVKAYNAVRGLSFAQNKEKVGYATSISVADARAVMEFAAQQTRNFFLGAAELAPGEPAGAPAGKRP